MGTVTSKRTISHARDVVRNIFSKNTEGRGLSNSHSFTFLSTSGLVLTFDIDWFPVAIFNLPFKSSTLIVCLFYWPDSNISSEQQPKISPLLLLLIFFLNFAILILTSFVAFVALIRMINLQFCWLKIQDTIYVNHIMIKTSQYFYRITLRCHHKFSIQKN